MADINGISSLNPRLYSSEEIDGPNACFAPGGAAGPAPAAKSPGPGDGEGAVERAAVGSLTPRSGETYEQCVNRYRNEMMQNYKVAGLFAGCIPGGLGGAAAGVVFGPPGVVIGAGLGCMAGGMGTAMAATGSGATSGEAEGKVACDGLPGSPEAAKNAPPSCAGSSSNAPNAAGRAP